MATESVAAEHSQFEADLRSQLHAVYAGRPWIVAGEVLQAATGLASELRDAGAERVFAVGAYTGVGEIVESIEHASVGLPVRGSAMDGIRAANTLLRESPPHVLDAVDGFDPTSSARTIVDFTLASGTICGRPTFGARPTEWEALEDKLIAQDLWEAAGIRAAPAEVVEIADRDAIIDAHRRLASWEGTVWAVDNASGWHGGAHGTFWVPDLQRAEIVLDDLDPAHRRVRIMPFLDGTPCSIHGMVVGDTTIAFRPMELLVYRDRAEPGFVYAKAASFWDPPARRRDEMRAAAVKLGDELRRRVDYQGVFTLDGVLVRSGFLPTEVNTRFGGALPMVAEATEGEPINLFLAHLGVIEGVLDFDARALESWACHSLDARRFCVAFFDTALAPGEEQEITVSLRGTGELEYRRSTDETTADDLATITWGTKGETGMIRIVGTQLFPAGPPAAPLVLDLAHLAAAHWNIGLAALEPAPPAKFRL